jgi:gliding motility-associated-like protein
MPNPGNSKLYIYDRYGKLVKQLTPNGKGWDGTFNGNPPDDWFSIKYTEDGIPKEFKSHFDKR